MVAETQSGHAVGQGGTMSDRIQKLDTLISQHMVDGWSAPDFAAALSLSTGHLSRLCRQATGLGAAAYIDRKRMVEACRLLAFTQLPISEIGYRVGYGDPSYLTKRFTRAQGLAPSAYRARVTR